MSILKKANDDKSIEYILPEVVVTATSWFRKFEWRNYWNTYLRYLQMNALFQPAWMMFETPFQRKMAADIVDGTKGFFVRGYRNHSEYKSALKSFNSMFEGDGALFPRFPQSKSSVPKDHYYGPGMTQSDGGQKFKPVEIFPDEALVNIDPYAHLNPGYTLKDAKLASKRLGAGEDRFYGETIFPVAVTILGAGHPVAAAGVVSVLRAGDTYRENPDFGIAVSKGLIGNLIERSSDPQLPQRFNEHPGEVIGGYLSDIPLVAALGIKFLPKTKVILGGKTAAYGTLKFTNKSTKFFTVEDTLQNSTIAGRAATEIKFSKGPIVNNSENLSAEMPSNPNLVPNHIPVLGRPSKALKPGTLSNIETRTWYLEQESRIPSLLDKKLSLEQQARQAFELRNQFRTEARELMADRNLAEVLNKTEKNLTWEQLVSKKMQEGYSGDELWKAIIESSQKSRASVNESLGLGK